MPLEAKHSGLSGSSGRPKRVDFAALVLRLVDKSDAGKLPWKLAAEARHVSLPVGSAATYAINAARSADSQGAQVRKTYLGFTSSKRVAIFTPGGRNQPPSAQMD